MTTDNTKPAEDRVELKPCPFCGGEVEAVRSEHTGQIAWVQHKLDEDQARCPMEFGGMDDALPPIVEAWNTRAAIAAIPTDPPPDHARELAEALGYAASLLNPVWDQGATVTQADLDMGRLRSLNQALAAALTKYREHHNGR